MFSQELESIQPQDSSCDKDITDHLEQSPKFIDDGNEDSGGKFLAEMHTASQWQSEDGIPGCDQSIGTPLLHFKTRDRLVVNFIFLP